MVALTFEEYGNSDVCKISLLRERKFSEKTTHGAGSSSTKDGETSRWVACQIICLHFMVSRFILFLL